ncbi:hypothetical protein D3C84_380430 [compost metagenome]
MQLGKVRNAVAHVVRHAHHELVRFPRVAAVVGARDRRRGVLGQGLEERLRLGFRGSQRSAGTGQ